MKSNIPLLGKGITKDEFKHGLTLLYGDFSFVLKAAPAEPLSPNAPSEPGSPITAVNLGSLDELASPGTADLEPAGEIK